MNHIKAASFHNNHFDSIQALRGIAALFVVLEHVRFLTCGAFGVDIFFCISGFMIMYTTHTQGTKHFLSKRLIRIVPLYYLMTLGTFLLLLFFPAMFQQTRAEISYLLKSLLFIPFDIGNGIIQPLVRIGWTVNCEMLFYLLFFLSMHISHKYRGAICSFFLGTLVLLAKLLPVGTPILLFYGNPVMLEFIFGIVCYYAAWGIYKLYSSKQLSFVWLPLSICTLLGLFAFLIVSKSHINILGFRRLLYWGLPGMIIVLSAFVMGLYVKMPRFSVQLGNISFSLYLIHYYPIMLMDRMFFDFSVYTPLALFGVAVSLLLCIALAYLSWYLIEQKLTGWLRRHLLS